MQDYKLMDLPAIKNQISHLMLSFWRPVPFEEDSQETEAAEDGIGEESPARYISAGWIIEALPSHSYDGNPAGGSWLGGGVSEMSYIFKAFKDHVDDRDLGKTYFDNEIEYIISGKLNDEKSRKAVYDKLIIERNGMNLIYLYSCTEKRQAALEAAEIITPLGHLLSCKESKKNGITYLEIPCAFDIETTNIFKKDENWALGLDAAVDSEFGEKENGELDTRETKKYVKPRSIEGQNYGDYLKTLLAAVPENKRLLRIMDLIQINMKYAYCDYFLMDDYYYGLKYEMTVNGRKYDFELVFVVLALVINVIAECDNVVFEECRIIHRLDMNAPEIFPDPKSSEYKVKDFDYLYSENGIDDLIGITAGADFKIEYPFDILGKIDFRMDVLSRAFTGAVRHSDTLDPEAFQDGSESKKVIIFPKYGEKYHCMECRYVKQEYEGEEVKLEMEQKDAELKGYTPCLICGG